MNGVNEAARHFAREETPCLFANAATPKKNSPSAATRFTKLDIRPQVEAENQGKYVAIDIETGAWEMDASETAAGDRLRLRVPDAQTWMMRIGYPYIRRSARAAFGEPRDNRNCQCRPGTGHSHSGA